MNFSVLSGPIVQSFPGRKTTTSSFIDYREREKTSGIKAPMIQTAAMESDDGSLMKLTNDRSGDPAKS
jgi:hypothetical protein